MSSIEYHLFHYFGKLLKISSEKISRELGPKLGNLRPVSFIFLRTTWQVCLHDLSVDTCVGVCAQVCRTHHNIPVLIGFYPQLINKYIVTEMVEWFDESPTMKLDVLFILGNG